MDDVAFLVIDDNSTDQMIASMLLKKTLDIEPEVYVKSSSSSTIDWIKTERNKVDKKVVVLLDMLMPDVDGFGFLEEYAQLDSALTSNNIVFMLSSMDDSTELVRTAKNNPLVKAVLDKPLDIEALKAVL